MNEFKSFFKKVTSKGEGSRCLYPTRLDIYGRGCQHNCSYCYSKSLLSFRNLWDPVNPAVADISKISKVIKKLDHTKVIRLGRMTDCFMPQEKEFKVTLKTLILLKLHRQPYLIVTKSSLIGEDNYIRALDRDLAHIQISFSTLNQTAANKIEHASPIKDRISAIEKLSAMDFDTSIRLAPLIPSDEYFDIDTVKIINRIECNKLLVEFLRVNTWVRKWLDIDYTPFTLKEGGYYHLELEKKLYYLNLLSTPTKKISVCEDVNSHYIYFQKYNPNKDDCCNLRG